MFQLMAEAFCHFIFSVNYNFLSIFIECLNRDLLRTDCFYKTVRETKASLNTFLHTALAYKTQGRSFCLVLSLFPANTFNHSFTDSGKP